MFRRYFQAFSYAMIACGTLALVTAGGMSAVLAAIFVTILITAWGLESSKWQLPERAALAVMLLSLPLSYVDWKYKTNVAAGEEQGQAGVAAFTHLILILSAIKLLQRKANRDWLFLYVLSFFEVLLAAGLSTSPRFLATLCLYLFFALATVICFEIVKANENLQTGKTRLLNVRRTLPFGRLAERDVRFNIGAGRLSLVVLCLLTVILTLALPIFFMAPRFGRNALARAESGLTGFVGFSEQMRLGDVGRLQQSDRVVMRVRLDGAPVAPKQTLRWRGVAFNHYDGRGWRRPLNEHELKVGNDRGFFQFGTTESLDRLTTQTFFIEPIDTPVLFVAPRAVALHGAFPFVRRDAESALSTRDHRLERISYRVYSDIVEPKASKLRAETQPYAESAASYLQLPDGVDSRLVNLAREVIESAAASNRYDKARAVEAHLSRNYRYSLERQANGPDPLADFLFRVREGHCEYFSTAMAVMLRTQGIATRVVNGFQMGEYNDTANAYIVRQNDAHSWVEVYFPETKAWVSFDPTPVEDRPGSASKRGLTAQLSKYAEAFELFWIQYVVAYDRYEQRSLANNARYKLGAYYQAVVQGAEQLRVKLSGWWRQPSTGREEPDGSSSINSASLILICALITLICLWARYVLRTRDKRR
ncbi:MAG: DUF3488 domain-containing protein, partial [Pyrinomonadaceae bacterium]|nr:DUF3488 domain-containing protein [Pyrinomonadaceae bacterium]